jgi:holo-[acyl-carrier protein] synthase
VIVGVGVDTVAIARIRRLAERNGERFLQRVFTAAEVAYCRTRHRPDESLAARFAAKEAVMKCLGTGWTNGVTFRDIEVTRDDAGAVGVRLSGEARDAAARRGIQRLHLSLSHTADDAIAFVVAER